MMSGNSFEDVRQSLNEGLAIAERNDERFQEAELHRLKGELLLAESRDQAAAEEGYRRAIETARRQGSRSWDLRATMSLARLWQIHGRRGTGLNDPAQFREDSRRAAR
jgi:predicted ATPase